MITPRRSPAAAAAPPAAGPAAALAALSLLAACADARNGYPSLAPRPVERAVLSAAAAPPEEPAPVPEPAPSAEVVEIVAGARAADTAFRAAIGGARSLIEAGRGAPMGSDAWIEGQQAYSALEDRRAPVGRALVELDHRRQVAIEAGDMAADAAAAAATLEVQALDEAERALLDQLLPA